eukprot:7205038-Prymnesium_polylepis.1
MLQVLVPKSAPPWLLPVTLLRSLSGLCRVPQWCSGRGEASRIPQRRSEDRSGAQTPLDFGRSSPLGDM